MGKGCLNDQQVTELVKIVDKIMKDHDKRQMARHGNLTLIFLLIGIKVLRLDKIMYTMLHNLAIHLATRSQIV